MAKIGPDALAQVLCQLPKFSDPNLMVGFESSDDAAVYKINEETVLIQTVDIFPPIVDDPYSYGKIAAVNALSDVYAMGGTPKLALNILCFPECLSKETLQAILQGGYEKVGEAGAVIAGGHTIKDAEPKYGLCVSGFAHPKDILKNNGIKPGDILILTKAIGAGIMTTAAKGGLLSDAQFKEVTDSMETLNRRAAELMRPFPVHACTDVTGFGLLGHAYEMAADSGCSVHIGSQRVPAFTGALDLAAMGIVPANTYQNRSHLEKIISIAKDVDDSVSDLLYDPQTSGGLLLSLPEKEGHELIARMNQEIVQAAVIGYVEEAGDYPIVVTKAL